MSPLVSDMEGEEEVAAVVLAEGQKESALLAGVKSLSPSRRSLSPKKKGKKKSQPVIPFSLSRHSHQTLNLHL